MSRRKSTVQGTIGRNVRRRRAKLNLSQEELAAISGFHRTYIGAVERAERNITIATLAALAEALSTTMGWLLENKADVDD